MQRSRCRQQIGGRNCWAVLCTQSRKTGLGLMTKGTGPTAQRKGSHEVGGGCGAENEIPVFGMLTSLRRDGMDVVVCEFNACEIKVSPRPRRRSISWCSSRV
jgi:hypothetical protein